MMDGNKKKSNLLIIGTTNCNFFFIQNLKYVNIYISKIKIVFKKIDEAFLQRMDIKLYILILNLIFYYFLLIKLKLNINL